MSKKGYLHVAEKQNLEDSVDENAVIIVENGETAESSPELSGDGGDAALEAGNNLGYVEPPTFTRTLPVLLTEEELADYSKEQARLFGVWQKTRLDKKAFDKAANSVIEETEEKLDVISQIVNNGSEDRSVLCFWSMDPDHGLKALIRIDTAEEVEVRNMELFDYKNGEPSIAAVEDAFGNQEPPAGEAGDGIEVVQEEVIAE